MILNGLISDLMMVPEKIWCEMQVEGDACDVIVKMENGAVYTALFATIPYIQRQMELMYMMTQNIPDSPAIRYAVLDTPHVMVEDLKRTTIDDAIDNLLTQDIFESLFTRVTEDELDKTRTSNDGKLATQEVAAVVIEDVLVVEGGE